MSHTGNWGVTQAGPLLQPGGGAVHLWYLSLAIDSQEDLGAWLSKDEQIRAAQFRFPLHRRRYMVARCALRKILARYLKTSPDKIAFHYNRFGKPFLVDEALQFNVAHTGDVAVMAFTSRCRVGVDVERVRADIMDENIAEHFFAPGELDALQALPVKKRPEAFFQCWTRKEAFIKAIGMGLSIPLHDFTVTLDPDKAALLETAWQSAEASHWTLRTFCPAPGYVGALAVEGRGWTLKPYWLSL